MAQQMKYCRNCGKQIDANAKFCRYCGYRFEGAAQPAGRAQQSQKPVGAASAAAAGLAGAAVTAAKGAAQSQAAAAVQTAKQQAGQVLSQVPGAGAVMNRVQEIAASANAGEESFDLGNLNATGLIDQATGGALGNAMGTINQVKGQVTEILSPVKTLLSGVKSFFGNLKDIIKNPKAAIPTIIMGILWIVLGMMRDSDSSIVKVLSWLTFSEGGLDRDAAGTIGGIFGKGVVAVAVTSLFNGGFRDIAAGLKTIFSGAKGNSGEKKSIGFLLIGVVIGILAYFAFTGFENASGITTMAGISGIMLSLGALGSKDGFLYKFAESLTSKVQNGVRTAQNGKMAGLFAGMTGGFAVITAFTALLW
ncbi:MAG: zinc ribbon domain-containing protein [Lachnospiraceae bacterium]|nr:zinc ribbon domain-containing protein [Lachnospiraceae bacterium]